MRGVPDRSPKEITTPNLPEPPAPFSFVPQSPIPAGMAALGREVLEIVPGRERGSLQAHREAANALSRILKVTGKRVKPKELYYTALRVKWMEGIAAEWAKGVDQGGRLGSPGVGSAS